MLNAHKDIAFLPETHFVRRYLHRKTDLADFSEDIKKNDNLRRSGLDISKLVSNCLTVKELYESILTAYGEQKKKSLVGDKDPNNIEYLKTITCHFPDSLIIHIYRDPRAVIASRKKAKWSEGRPLWMHLLAYKTQINYGRLLGKTAIKNYYEIKYEDLVCEPKVILTKLLNTLNMEYDSNIEVYYRTSSEIISGKEISWKKKCFEPVSKEGLARWQDELSVEEVATIEYVLATEMCEFDYPATQCAYTGFSNFRLWIYRGFIQFAAFIYRFKFR